jgi:serine/threonine-protein kinase HipA
MAGPFVVDHPGRPHRRGQSAETAQIRLTAFFTGDFIADGDMHLKNLALPKLAGPGDTRFRSVRVAPLYHAVTTRVFPRLANDRLALKLNGKDDGLRRRDFRAFARTAGISAADAHAAADAMLSSLTRALKGIRLPIISGFTKES